MAEKDPLYRLVVFDELDDPHPVRDLFSAVTGSHPTDSMQWVSKVPGVWPKLLPEDQTRKLLDGLYELEVAAEAWRVDAFPDISRPRTIHEAACLDGGFRVTGIRGEPTHWVPWDKIELVAAGKIAAEDEYRDTSPPGWVDALSTGFRAAFGYAPHSARRQRAMRIPRDPLGEVIIVRKDPRIAFRVIESQMNYGYLGDRIADSASENFPKPATKALMKNDEPGAYLFATTQALLDDATIKLLWSWYRRDRDTHEGTGEHRTLT